MGLARFGFAGTGAGGRARVVPVLALVFALVLVTAAPATAGFADRQRLHGGDLDADWPVVAMNGNKVHAFWTEWGSNGNAIYYARSTNGGQTWTSAQRISASSVGMRRPDVVVVGNDIHVVFGSDHLTPDIREVYYLRSRDGGATWDRTRMLSQNDGKPSVSPSVGAEGNHVYVAWADIWYPGDPKPAATVTRFSDDAGNRFRPQQTAFLGFDVAPYIAVLDGVVHMVFENSGDVWYQRSGNGGRKWTAPRRISPASLDAASDQVGPQMDIEAGNGSVHVVFATDTWTAGISREAVYYRRLDHVRGWIWNRSIKVAGSGSVPMVNAGGGEVAVVWLRYKLGTGIDPAVSQKIVLRTSGNGGSDWRSSETIASYSTSCRTTHAGVATMGDAVVVWNAVRGCNSDAYAVRNV